MENKRNLILIIFILFLFYSFTETKFNKNINLKIYVEDEIKFIDINDLNNVDSFLKKLYGNLDYLPLVNVFIILRNNFKSIEKTAKLVKTIYNLNSSSYQIKMFLQNFRLSSDAFYSNKIYDEKINGLILIYLDKDNYNNNIKKKEFQGLLIGEYSHHIVNYYSKKFDSIPIKKKLFDEALTHFLYINYFYNALMNIYINPEFFNMNTYKLMVMQLFKEQNNDYKKYLVEIDKNIIKTNIENNNYSSDSFYIILFSDFYRYIWEKYGFEKFRKFINDTLKSDMDFNTMIRNTFGIDYDTLLKNWIKDLKRNYTK